MLRNVGELKSLIEDIGSNRKIEDKEEPTLEEKKEKPSYILTSSHPLYKF
jgi:hypothetical protein